MVIKCPKCGCKIKKVCVKRGHIKRDYKKGGYVRVPSKWKYVINHDQ